MYVLVPLLLLFYQQLVFLDTLLVPFIANIVFFWVCESHFSPVSLKLIFHFLNGDQYFQLFQICTREVDVYYLVIWVITKDLILQVVPEHCLQFLERIILLVFG